MRNKEQKKEYARLYYLSHKDTIIARSKKHHSDNQARTNERQREFYHRKGKWKLVPGWTEELFASTLSLQEGKCAICEDELIQAVRDHNHTTGEARGLLCHSCNLMLGNAKDSGFILQKGIEYLAAYEYVKEKIKC